LISEYRESAKKATLREYPDVDEILRAQQKAQKKASAGAAIPQSVQGLIDQFLNN